MKVANNFDKAVSSKALQKGAYECIIINAKEDVTRSGKVCIKVAFDINTGEFKGYFKQKYEDFKSKSANAFWTGLVSLFPFKSDGTTNNYFIYQVECFETDNSTVTLRKGDEFLEQNLKNCKFGAVFARKQKDNGYWDVVLDRIIPISEIPTAEIPPDESNDSFADNGIDSSLTIVDDENIPF